MKRREQSAKSAQLPAEAEPAILRKMLVVVGYAGALVLSAMIGRGVMAQNAAGGAEKVQPAKAMAVDAHPVFEVAAIKPSDPNESTNGFRAEGRHIFIMNQTLMKMVTFAYGVQQSQVIGGPEWASTVRYDIDGVPDVEGGPNIKQLREMIQKLLSDRFGLTFHRETRELPVYAISVAKGGAKLTSAADPNGVSGESGLQHGTELTMRFTNSSIADLALNMQLVMDRPIVDRTGLAGTYDFKLRYTIDETRATDPNAPPGLFTAIQEQLGLKLEAVKAPTQVLVVDKVEQPSAN
jgi:uncharacterized protein (TIGR03435 family)